MTRTRGAAIWLAKRSTTPSRRGLTSCTRSVRASPWRSWRRRSQIHLNARSGPLGEDPRGHFFVRAVFPDADVRGSISCLTVVGNTASVGLEIERSRTPAFPEGSGLLLFVADNGEPGDDDSFNGFFTPTPPQVCPPPFPQSGAGLFQGNYVVHDAAP